MLNQEDRCPECRSNNIKIYLGHKREDRPEPYAIGGETALYHTYSKHLKCNNCKRNSIIGTVFVK